MVGREWICMPVGDWSDDGHGKCTEIDFLSSHRVAELRDAYKASVRLTGLTFNHSETWGADNPIEIFTDYEENKIPEEAVVILKKHGFDFGDSGEEYFDPDRIAELILWFIGLSLTDFEYEIPSTPNKVYLNGFWCEDLNVQFGYGLFY